MNESTYKTGTSTIVKNCQICQNDNLEPILFLGYLPPVNKMNIIGNQPKEQPSYPAQLLYCNTCHLVQLGLIVDPEILFPPEYPYTSSTTKILRDNFNELYQECRNMIKLDKEDLIVDIGSNDGNLLSNFKENHKVLGITPEDIGKLAIEKGIPTILDYFKKEVVDKIKLEHGQAKVITATNVFAHIENINDIVKLISDLLTKDGIFISESHYLSPLIKTLQYDTIYHEHLRYYSLHSLKFLLEKHGFEIIHAKEIPTHGGSIRVYAAKIGTHTINNSVQTILNIEKETITQKNSLVNFKNSVVNSKLELMALLNDLKKQNKKIVGIGAPSRASTLINYTGINEDIISSVMEIQGSHKIGKYIPGTLIPVLEESKLYEEQPDFAILLSWHIAEELAEKIKEKGFQGDFIIPLPIPRILRL